MNRRHQRQRVAIVTACKWVAVVWRIVCAGARARERMKLPRC